MKYPWYLQELDILSINWIKEVLSLKILIVGSGGREHAIAWKVAQNPKVEKIYCAPGNGGTALMDKCENIDIEEIGILADFAEENAVDLTIVGPEVPLVNGIVDIFKERGLKIFGPSKKAAALEGSKSFSKPKNME